jgi:ArsR family transcriptional regulator
MRRVVHTYKALSDPNRLRILMMLKEKSLCVCEMVDVLALANSTVSKHLSLLRNADLIMDEKEGRWVNYRLATAEESDDVVSVMDQLEKQLGKDDQILQDRKQLGVRNRYDICGSSPP